MNQNQSQANYFYFGSDVNHTMLMQTFLPTESVSIDTVCMVFSKAGSPADNVICQIWDAGYTTLYGTANAVAGTTIVPGFGGIQVFTFPTPIAITSGNELAIVFSRSGAVDASNFYRPLGNATGAYTSGLVYQYDSTGPGWVLSSGASMNFDVSLSPHRIHLLGCGGNGAAGTTGTSGNGGGGGAGGNWGYLFATNSINNSEINPGYSSIVFAVPAGGAGTFTCWGFANTQNSWYTGYGQNASGITGGTSRK